MVAYRIVESDDIQRADIIPLGSLPNGTKVNLLSQDRNTGAPRTDVPSNATEAIGNNRYKDGSDVDLFGIQLKQGDVLVIDVDARNNDGAEAVQNPIIGGQPLYGSPASRLNSSLKVFTANGKELVEVDDAIEPDTGVFGRDPAVKFTAPTPGINTYYIGISASGNGNYNPFIADKASSGSGKVVPDPRVNGTPEGSYQLELTYFAAPSFYINDVSVIEGTNGFQTAVFTVDLSYASDLPHSISYETLNGTAIVGQDYESVSGALTFVPGTTRQTISVPIVTDNLVELNENFFLNLFNSTNGATIADPQGIGTILNNDTGLISINDPTVIEGNDGQQQMVFNVSLSNPVDTWVTLDFATSNNTAIADSDFVGINQSIVFAPGQTSVLVPVPILGDTAVELDETFFANLSNLQAGGRDVRFADTQGTGTIQNDDRAIVTIGDATTVEGNSGQQQINFTVSLDNPVDTAVVLDYNIILDTADVNDLLEINTGGSIQFEVSETTKTITLNVSGDLVVERDETFFVNLSNSQVSGRDVTIGDSQGIGAIQNDDVGEITISDVSITEENDGQQYANFTVTLSNPVDVPITLDYTTADGTAISDSDYQTTNGSLTFASGETIQTISVPVIGDRIVERDESFFVNLLNLQAGERDIRLIDTQGLGIIVNDDFGADLSITKTDGVDLVVLNDEQPGALTYTIVVANNGPSSATNVVVTDLFPSELKDMTWRGVGTLGAYGYESNLQTGDLVDDGISLLPGASITYTVNAFISPDIPCCTTLSNTATISSNDPTFKELNPANNSAIDSDTRAVIGIPGTDNDDLIVGTPNNDRIEVLKGDDVVAGGLGSDFLCGGDGNDILRGDGNTSKSESGKPGGDDIIYGGEGNDAIAGKSGNDRLYGEEGDDNIFGDDGDDLLWGGLGNDRLRGDATLEKPSRDVFVLAKDEGKDTITDFQVKYDSIGLANGLTFGQLTFIGNDIKLGNEILASLNGVNTTTLTAASFVVV
jgi:Ca2+-binding RTX toxin-like protein